MIVLYDHQIFESQVFGGISRYYYELISGVEDSGSKENVEYRLPLKNSSNHYIKKIDSIEKKIESGSDYYNRFARGLSFPGKWRLYQYWSKYFSRAQEINQLNTLNHLSQKKFDLFHPTDISDYFLDKLNGKPFVITIHDMIDEYFPEYSFHTYSKYKTSIKERLIQQAAGVIAVSESTKRDIIDRFSTDEKKIKVIYHGSSLLQTRAEGGGLVLPFPYLLYVGKRTHYKNFYFLLQCLQSILRSNASLKVVCVGTPFIKKEQEYFSDLNIQNNVVHYGATDNELFSLYKNAIAFIYPSLYEGFGMPILEAFSAECPVVLSHASSHLEVAGDAALYFDPKDVESTRHAIEQVLFSNTVREELIVKGLARAKQFTWEKTVSETLCYYKSLV